jgi:ATP-binding cassette subfamily A (ABC1) protein 3
VKNRKCKHRNITKIVHKFIPEAVKEPRVGAELNYILPSETTNKFETLFDILEKNRATLGIDSFGASVTTMEEVFIK